EIELAFLDCMPHLLNTYLSLGFRTYTRVVNSPHVGFLVPMCLVVNDYEYLEQIRSPLAPLGRLKLGAGGSRATLDLPFLKNEEPVFSSIIQESEEYQKLVLNQFTNGEITPLSFLDGLQPEALQRVLPKSHLVKFSAGDQIIKKGTLGREV